MDCHQRSWFSLPGRPVGGANTIDAGGSCAGVAFSHGDMAGGFDKFAELGIAHRRSVDPGCSGGAAGGLLQFLHHALQ